MLSSGSYRDVTLCELYPYSGPVVTLRVKGHLHDLEHLFWCAHFHLTMSQ